MKWETACRFSTCVVRSFLYLDTHFVCILNVAFFADVLFFAYFKSVIKISKGFKKWNCFRKTGLTTSVKVWIVGTETSVTKGIFRKYKFHVLKWKMLIYLSLQKIVLAPRSNAKSHSFFTLVVMFNLTSFWIRDNSISLSERIIRHVVYNHALWRTLSVCRVLLRARLHKTYT